VNHSVITLAKRLCFFNSQSDYEKRHIIDALRFELGKVTRVSIRQRMIGLLTQVDEMLANQVALGLGLQVPMKPEEPMNRSFGAETDPASVQPIKMKSSIEKSKALSMEFTIKSSIKSRKIAALMASGFSWKEFELMKIALKTEGAKMVVIAPTLGFVKSNEGKEVKVDFSFMTAASVLFDAVFIPGGMDSVESLSNEADAFQFVDEAFRHCKAIAATGEGVNFLSNTYAGKAKNDEAIIKENDVTSAISPFIKAISKHRNWDRESARHVPS